MDWIVRLPSALYRLSVKKAGTDRELQAHIRQYLERWTTEPHAVRPGELVMVQTDDGSAYGWAGGGSGGVTVGGTVFCPDCQQVHAPGPCPRVT